MSLYFFNVFDGHSSADTEGTDLPNRQSARREAIRLTGDILRDEAPRLIADEDWRLEVTDTAGRLVLALDLFLTEAPSVPSRMTSLR